MSINLLLYNRHISFCFQNVYWKYVQVCIETHCGCQSTVKLSQVKLLVLFYGDNQTKIFFFFNNAKAYFFLELGYVFWWCHSAVNWWFQSCPSAYYLVMPANFNDLTSSPDLLNQSFSFNFYKIHNVWNIALLSYFLNGILHIKVFPNIDFNMIILTLLLNIFRFDLVKHLFFHITLYR